MWVYAMPFCKAIFGIMLIDSQIARTVPWMASGLRDAMFAAI
jgi:hypothetical protein